MHAPTEPAAHVLPSAQVVPLSFVPLRFAVLRSTQLRSAPDISALVRFALVRFALTILHPFQLTNCSAGSEQAAFAVVVVANESTTATANMQLRFKAAVKIMGVVPLVGDPQSLKFGGHTKRLARSWAVGYISLGLTIS